MTKFLHIPQLSCHIMQTSRLLLSYTERAENQTESRFPDPQSSTLTFNCDFDTFPHCSASSDVNAYQMDFRSSDFRSIFWGGGETASCVKAQLHCFIRAARSGCFTHRRQENCQIPRGAECKALSKRKNQRQSDVGQT